MALAAVTQGAFALADQGLLVPLHPLQLLFGAHAAPLLLLLLLRLPRVQLLQGTFGSLLGAPERREWIKIMTTIILLLLIQILLLANFPTVGSIMFIFFFLLLRITARCLVAPPSHLLTADS